MITAGTLHKVPLFHSPAKLDLFRQITFRLLEDYGLSLRAWAFFNNHYHSIVGFEHSSVSHRVFIRRLHRELALRLNEIDTTPSRKVMYQFSSWFENQAPTSFVKTVYSFKIDKLNVADDF